MKGEEINYFEEFVKYSNECNKLTKKVKELTDLLNRSNLRLSEVQLENSKLKEELKYHKKQCDNCEYYYCAEWAEGTKCHMTGCRDKSKWEPKLK